MERGKIIFADQLRGLAASMVLLAHLFIANTFNISVLNEYVYSSSHSSLVYRIKTIFEAFDFATFGVGLFFLISGFVIPMSFRRHGARAFLLARFFRIWPTYFVALCCSILVQTLTSHLLSMPLHCSAWDIFGNVLLIQDFIGVKSIDFVNWTLTVEVIFYLVVAMCYDALLKWKGWAVVAGACILPLLIDLSVVFPNIVALKLNVVRVLICLPYMLIGFVLYLQFIGIIGFRSMLITSLSALFFVVVSTAILVPIRMAIGFTAAFLLFFALFLANRNIRRIRFLTMLSAISYPLYLVHSTVCSCALLVATQWLHFGFLSGAVIAVVSAVAIASILHFAVERPSMNIGKLITLKSSGGGGEVSPAVHVAFRGLWKG